MMKIAKLGIYRFQKPFRFGFHSSQTLRTGAESIIVKLQLENGITGYGESTPRSYSTGENHDSVVSIIREIFAPILFSCEIVTLADVENVLNDLENECLKKSSLPYNSALGAIDIALLDALGKSQRCSIAAFLGPTVEAEIPHSISVPFLNHEKIRRAFTCFEGFEFKNIKILLSDNEMENLDRVSLVRSLVGNKVNIRVDVNEHWTIPQAISNLDKLQEFNITGVEQPLPKDDIEGLKQLRKIIGVPIILDESVCSLSDAKKLIEEEACDIINIKISKCGGILRSCRIARFAAARNIRCQLGAHVGETNILTAAGKYFALTTRNLICFDGYSSLLFQDLWGKKKVDIDLGANLGFSGFGLGLGKHSESSIENDCETVAELFESRKSDNLGKAAEC